MDIIAFVAGLIVGIVAVSIAVEFAWKKSVPEKTCKLIRKWDLHEVKNPLIAAEKLLITPPENAKVVVGTPSSFAKHARENPNVTGNYVVGVNKAFIFAGDIKEGQLAVVTSDEDILKDLRDTFYAWYKTREKKSPYVVQKGTVTIRGIVRAVFPYRDGYLMRISHEGGVVGVLIKDRMDVEGRRVEVEGQMLDPPFMNPQHITLLD
ncbi:MAG TPA: hypothetical protein ENG06_01785 [Thermoplasmatales archaeon]|nr:MAG: hypothetical protein FE046_02830 [Thermoplasmata archaeon]RLF32880.1 MAG: hypothetical protein DRN07_03990 [Thermoplasmata archaeon]RLF55283.1 MAG: hypothetical protein DRN37_09295 [Thermoplasmata archaeon]HDN50488.1 hypothetical protein [Thermoplasmatales archaeon]